MDRPSLAYVLDLVVRAVPIRSLVHAGILPRNFSQLFTPVEQLTDDAAVLRVVGLDQPLTTRLQHAEGRFDEIRLEQAAFMVALFRPGVGVVNVQGG